MPDLSEPSDAASPAASLPGDQAPASERSPDVPVRSVVGHAFQPSVAVNCCGHEDASYGEGAICGAPRQQHAETDASLGAPRFSTAKAAARHDEMVGQRLAEEFVVRELDGSTKPLGQWVREGATPSDHAPDYSDREHWLDPRCRVCDVERSRHPAAPVEPIVEWVSDHAYLGDGERCRRTYRWNGETIACGRPQPQHSGQPIADTLASKARDSIVRYEQEHGPGSAVRTASGPERDAPLNPPVSATREEAQAALTARRGPDGRYDHPYRAQATDGGCGEPIVGRWKCGGLKSDHPEVVEADPPRDTGYAPTRWEFDDEVSRVFDDMFARSIPQYEVMRRTVLDVAHRYAQDKTDIVDLGAARGESIAQLYERRGGYNRYVAVEVSEPMLAALRQRFAGLIAQNVVEVNASDLRERYPSVSASVTLAVLTLVFVPINHRQRVLRDAYRHTRKGGAIILVEKVLGATADLDGMMVTQYHAMKRDHGYSRDEIERKRLALEGVQVPVTAEWNVDLLRQAGFRQIDCFWRWMNFAAWVGVRDD